MTYSVKELFHTLQGEGGQTGRAAVFCRFAGCNLWTGREADRDKATCQFCDTDFIGTDGPGGGRFDTASTLAKAIAGTWPAPGRDRRFVVFTGGEPLLQLDSALIDAVHEQGFTIAVESNGTIAAPPGIDWLCISPKAGSTLVQKHGQELKLVYPQTSFNPRDFLALDFEQFWLQPMDGPDQKANTEAATRYCLENPRWRLSLQTHKLIGIP
ncbi:7-carboxy-7-deazaguanine synthase [Acetobacter fallax]|uniref:7-carboxy-7-deazaguanine synthase n=1 Tax=Acetobacter fallax TaxID=1737473 RepID=A0ABX0KDJ8_9PROT|nr:7-carboxy-7-deazaguanine synthase [Acetobacter fallax]NHO33161.1 7-carboxy-7-deazaguanine synthase [Acetobacter fallax]NHO36818.1 7-carboxy-7-deazaguanine synthase [Acetobacter fallax]